MHRLHSMRSRGRGLSICWWEWLHPRPCEGRSVGSNGAGLCWRGAKGNSSLLWLSCRHERWGLKAAVRVLRRLLGGIRRWRRRRGGIRLHTLQIVSHGPSRSAACNLIRLANKTGREAAGVDAPLRLHSRGHPRQAEAGRAPLQAGFLPRGLVYPSQSCFCWQACSPQKRWLERRPRSNFALRSHMHPAWELLQAPAEHTLVILYAPVRPSFDVKVEATCIP